MPPLNSDAILRAEANAIHASKPQISDETRGEDLYRILNERNSSALCLSGGGIRSASFALGVIQALAIHPRPNNRSKVGDESKSLLRQFDYLSTVSGGGYIGGWLSAWIARAGYPAVWHGLVGHSDHPDEEPGAIAWLRAYSGYIIPKSSFFSTETWTALALYVRNLILNWFVVLPALCILLFAIKLASVGAYWTTTKPDQSLLLLIIGVFLMIWTLRFKTRNRPSCNPRAPVPELPSAAQQTVLCKRVDHHRDELSRVSAGADQVKFFWLCLLPAILASNVFALFLTSKDMASSKGPLWYFAVVGIDTGIFVYAISWLAATPFKTANEQRSVIYWIRDFTSWSVGAGSTYGALAALGAYLFVHMDLSFLILHIDVPDQTAKLLITIIYGPPWFIGTQLAAEMIFSGLTNWQRSSGSDRQWFARSAGWFAAAAILWLIVNFAILIGTVFSFSFFTQTGVAEKLLSVIGTFVLGFFSQRLLGTTPKDQVLALSEALLGWFRWLLPVTTGIFLILLLLMLSAMFDYLMFGNYGLWESPLLGAGDGENYFDDLKWLAIGVGAVLIVAFFFWTRVNINQISVNALYRDRLIRAYLGASNPARAPNPFTGFDVNDNFRMASLWSKQGSTWQPFHVVNIALNLIASSRLAWQERKAVPFTVTPLHCGTASLSDTTMRTLGYRPTSDYGDAIGGITLGTALAVSGAAANPNTGHHSSPLVNLLLALFNRRMGWWLGNPGALGEESYRNDGPTIAIIPFVFEVFGQTTDTRRYVYLSDGGHFENLGLFEMIRRRCKCIVVSDAGYDPNYNFEDLGNSVRKIRTDLGVEIHFSGLRELKKQSIDKTVSGGASYAVGRIDYKNARGGSGSDEDGYILYIKPIMRGTESIEIASYSSSHAAFPHEAAWEHAFGEAQFEAYRALGFEIMDDVLVEAAQNVDTINMAYSLRTTTNPGLSTERLCDLIRSLDATIVGNAENILKPVPEGKSSS